jgi:hypothetical protein
MNPGVVVIDMTSSRTIGAGVIAGATDMFSLDLAASGVLRGTELIWKELMSSDESWLSLSAAMQARKPWPDSNGGGGLSEKQYVVSQRR